MHLECTRLGDYHACRWQAEVLAACPSLCGSIGW
jgi:hypothetical protein